MQIIKQTSHLQWVWVCALAFFSALSSSWASRILITSAQLGSHVLEKVAIGEALVSRGHEVYLALALAYPKRSNIEKSGIKVVTYNMPEGEDSYFMTEKFLKERMEMIFRKDANIQNMREYMSGLLLTDCKYMMNDVAFLKQIQELNFDLVIAEPFVLCPCNLLLPQYLGINFVTLTSFYFPWEIRTPALPSFVKLSEPYTNEEIKAGVGFVERFIVAVRFTIFHQSSWIFPGRKDTSLLEKYGNGVHSWEEMVRRSNLYLFENDHRMGEFQPQMANVVTVAGLTASEAKNLPDELEKIMTEAGSDGVILLSFGSSAYHVPEWVIKLFFEAFSQLNQTIIARFPAPEGVVVPKNVKLQSWLPQNDLLGHHQTKLFITHCGSNGQHEALYHGVPMLGFPLFAEQHGNCQRAIKKGFGLCMDIMSSSSDTIVQNIREILYNDKYKRTTKLASDIWRDDITTPRQRATFWIEHVIKYGGQHLRHPAMDMPLYQFLMLDILIVVAFIFLVILYIAKRIISYLINKFCHKSTSVSKKKEQ